MARPGTGALRYSRTLGARHAPAGRRSERRWTGRLWRAALAVLLAGPAAGQASASVDPPEQVHRLPAPDTASVGDRAARSWLFPGRHLLPTLLAGPRDPVVKGQLVYADPDPTAYGPGVSGEVSLAGAVPVLLLAGHDASNALVVGLEAAAFARFSFEVITRELVNTDWIFAVPIVWHRGPHWLRLRYYHTSSHLGDEYQRRFGPASINYFRDGIDLAAYVRPTAGRPLGLGLYGTALWSVNSDPEASALWRGRAGFELDPYSGRPWALYGALDIELEEHRERPRWTGQVGLWLPPAQGRPLRFAIEVQAGPSALGQFYRRDTRRVALGLFWNP